MSKDILTQKVTPTLLAEMERALDWFLELTEEQREKVLAKMKAYLAQSEA